MAIFKKQMLPGVVSPWSSKLKFRTCLIFGIMVILCLVVFHQSSDPSRKLVTNATESISIAIVHFKI